MKKIIIVIITLISFSTANSQVKDPVTFQFKAIKRAPSIYEIVVTADIAKPWHMYSQSTPKGGPIPTKITFNNNPLIVKEGKISEKGKMEKINDKVFGVQVFYYSDKVVYSQTVKVKGLINTNITGTVSYMVCDDTQCLPPTKKAFDIKLQ